MKTYEQVDQYMQEVGLKYIKSSNEFIAGLAYRTDKNYATKIAEELNSRANRSNSSNMVFYKMKNESLEGSIYISAAFDGGLFRHLGNLIIDNADCFKGTVIDYACDCGIVTCFIARMNPDSHIIGIDVNSSAIDNANALAKKLGVTNVEFVCGDVFEYVAENKADCACSFRSLLDVCMARTNDLPFFGERAWREAQYKNAFSDYANVIANNLKDDGKLISVERYTADYGLLGWMMALEEAGVSTTADRCMEMRAADLSSVKDYSVTFGVKDNQKDKALLTLEDVLSRSFKSGTGYDSYMAEFAFYYDSDGEKRFYDIYKGEKLLHQFGSATAKSGKVMYYEASGNKKRIKYANAKKKDTLDKNLQDNLAIYNADEFKIKEYSL